MICLQIPIKKKQIYAEKEGLHDALPIFVPRKGDSLGNVNYAISVVGYWIFDSNYEKALVLNRASLDMICAPSVGE